MSGPREPVHPQPAALHSLSLSVDSGQGPQPPSYGPEARAAPSPCVMSGSKDGPALYLPPGADSEKAGRTRREGKAEEWGAPESRRVGEGRDAQGVAQRLTETAERNTQRRREGGREREENQLHPHEGGMA